MSREELQTALGLQDCKYFTARYLKPALNAALIEIIIPEKPNSIAEIPLNFTRPAVNL